MEVKMKELITFIFLFSLILTISCCEQEESVKETQAEIAGEEELMKKYGPKDLTEEQVDSIIESIEWETNKNPSILGSENAKKGGMAVLGYSNYPATLRPIGENSNNLITQLLALLVYETLLKIDPVTYEYIPGLADKWSISEDKTTYFFHIDEKAKWQDGLSVTAFDVVATYDLLVDEGTRNPYENDFYSSKYERPIALTPDIVMVKAKILQWSLFLYFSMPGTYILPEHIITKIKPSEYLTKYNNQMMIGSGPYSFDKAIPNQIIVLKRDTNWWAAKTSLNENLYNLDNLKINFYTDETVLFENFKKGNIDIAPVISSTTINKWVNEFTSEKMDEIKNNYIIKQKVYCEKPQGHGGFAFNMREEPFKDIRVRKAISLLFNRSKLIEKLFYGEYKHMDSYYPNSMYENKNNMKIRYNPEEAISLLEETGYSQKNLNEEGYIVKDGKPFELNLNVYRSDDTRIETLFQEELKKVGIKLNLKKVTWATHIKELDERDFKIIWINYTTMLFPNPEHAYHSKYADKSNTNNIYGFKNKKVDELCEKYNKEFDFNKRKALAQQIDSILVSNYLMALNWYSDNIKILYWNKFGTPDFVISGVSYSGEITFRLLEIIVAFWWYDKEADKKLQNSIENDLKLPSKAAEVRVWEKYH
jgi:microcin C transport system substrate-binding protein